MTGNHRNETIQIELKTEMTLSFYSTLSMIIAIIIAVYHTYRALSNIMGMSPIPHPVKRSLCLLIGIRMYKV